MSESQVLYASEGGVATLTLNRPEKKNALTVAMYAALVEGLTRAEQDKAVRVIVLRGNGDYFTSGNDLKDFMNDPPAGFDSPVFQLLLKLVDLEKPLVAAVQGAAIGVGTTALLHCDLVYAREDAKLHMPFVNLGLCPEGGSSLLFPRLAGLQKTTELLMFGDPFGAADAMRMGLVNEVFPAASFDDEVRTRVQRLVEKPAASLRATKELLRGRYREEVKDAMMREGAAFLERLVSPEAAEAFGAFFEKRKPDFTQFE